MAGRHAFASTRVSIDVSDEPIYIRADTDTFVGKFVRFLSMLQWGRIVTFKGYVKRFTIKCQHCTYGLSGTKCEEDNLWRVSVTKASGNSKEEFTSNHSDDCAQFGDIQEPPRLLAEIPDGMESELSREDLFILRSLGVSFNEAKLDKQVLRRSKVASAKWDVEGFISYVQHYRDNESVLQDDDLDSISLARTSLAAQSTALIPNFSEGIKGRQEKPRVVSKNTGKVISNSVKDGLRSTRKQKSQDTVEDTVVAIQSIPRVGEAIVRGAIDLNGKAVRSRKQSSCCDSPVIVKNGVADTGSTSSPSMSHGVNAMVPVVTASKHSDLPLAASQREDSDSLTYSPITGTIMGSDDLASDASSVVSSSKTSSLKRKTCDAGMSDLEPDDLHESWTTSKHLAASTAANMCIELSHLFPLNTNLGTKFETKLKELKAAKCYMATQEQALCKSLNDIVDELESYKKIKMAPRPALIMKPRTKCSICHVIQEDVLPSQECSHQFCVDCFIVTGRCPLCPLSSQQPPLKKRKTDSAASVAANHETMMFDTYMKIVESCTLKKSWALMKIAQCYEDGIGVVKDNAKAVENYILSADGGNRFAQYRLAQLYEEGELVLQSNELSQRWYKAAAAQQHAGAQGVLATDDNMAANFLFNHILSEESEHKCDQLDCEWQFYDRCSKIGNPDASRYLGECCLHGSGFEHDVDYVRAVQCFKLARDQGDMSAEPLWWYGKGMKEYYEKGVGRFVEGACECFYQAALLGHRRSMERYLLSMIPAFASQQPIGLSADMIPSIPDCDLMKIFNKFVKEAEKEKEYLEVYFKRESSGSPLLPPDVEVKRGSESYDERLMRVQTVFAKNYTSKQAMMKRYGCSK